MKYYKPDSLEENYSNVLILRDNFMNQINAFIWEYNNIVNKYENPNVYNQLLHLNLVNPYLNGYEAEMRNLAYGIYGFTSTMFETLSYALDYWRIQVDSTQRNRAVTDKQYDQALQLLAKKKKISGNDKEILLDFRKERNFGTHYGRIYFCRYIFDRRDTLINLINVMAILLGNMNVDENVIKAFNDQQGAFVEEMKEVLGLFAAENCKYA